MTPKNIQQNMKIIFNELQSDVYDIPENILHRIKKYLSNCVIQFTFLENPNIDKPDNSIAKVVEKINFYSTGKISITPYLYIVKEQKNMFADEILFHEIMHLFSVGDCFQQTNSPKIFLHKSGLDLYHIYTTGKIVRINRCSFLNELLNDSIAAFLYEKLIQKPYHGNPQFSCLHFHDFLIQQLEKKNYTKEHLIRSYFSHDDKLLAKILSSSENLDQLDDKIYESYIQKAPFLQVDNSDFK